MGCFPLLLPRSWVHFWREREDGGRPGRGRGREGHCGISFSLVAEDNHGERREGKGREMRCVSAGGERGGKEVPSPVLIRRLKREREREREVSPESEREREWGRESFF